MYFWQIASRMF